MNIFEKQGNSHNNPFMTILPGLLPLFVYIGADFFFDTRWSMVVVTAFSIAEFIVSYIIFKHTDYFILFDLLLVLIFSTLSLLLDSPVFFRIKPAIIQLLFCIILGISGFTKKNLLLKYMRRFLRSYSPSQQQQMAVIIKKTSAILFALFLPHTFLIAYTAKFSSTAVWAFVSTVLPWILIAIAFILIIGQQKFTQFYYNIRYRKSEWFDIVTPEGVIIGRAPREICHKRKELLHPVVHLFVFNSNGELFLQKRSPSKKIQPDKWDTSVGGHIASGESVEKALVRETEEELGFTPKNSIALYHYAWRSEIESELVYAFAVYYDGAIAIDKNEISEGRFWKIDEIEKKLNDGTFTPNFVNEFDTFLKKAGLLERIINLNKAPTS